MGGEILFVEAAKMPGSGELVLTGQLGEIGYHTWSMGRYYRYFIDCSSVLILCICRTRERWW